MLWFAIAAGITLWAIVFVIRDWISDYRAWQNYTPPAPSDGDALWYGYFPGPEKPGVGSLIGFSLAALFFVGAISVMVATLINLLVGVWVYDTKDTRVELASLKDSSSVSGRFFLGSGVIDSSSVYRYYQKDNGAYTLETVYAEDARIIEDGDPHLVVTTAVPSIPLIAAVVDHSPFYTFHVPEGSIQQDQFVLDAE